MVVSLGQHHRAVGAEALHRANAVHLAPAREAEHDLVAVVAVRRRRRARREGLPPHREWVACDLRPLADDSFDLVVSVFGAMFAPKPFEVTKERVRVTKPGGRIVMGNLDSGRPDPGGADPEGQLGLFAAAARRLHQPDDLGRGEQRARALHRGVPADAVSCARDSFTFDFAGTPAQFVGEFRHYYGPTMNAFEAAGKSGRADALQAELEALFTSQNKSGRADRTVVPATFLRVTIAVR